MIESEAYKDNKITRLEAEKTKWRARYTQVYANILSIHIPVHPGDSGDVVRCFTCNEPFPCTSVHIVKAWDKK